MSNFYCIWVRTGFENKFIEKVQAVFDSFPEEENGKLHCVGKQMRLKSGKEYIDPLFPGYVFWESDNYNQGYVNNNILGTAIHTIIGMVPSGCYVELARGVLDFITNFSGVSYECVKVYAIASVSSILSKNFNDFLSAYQQTDYEGYHVSDIYRAIYYEPDIAVNLLITLSYARKASECQMKTANEANTWIFEWYFKEFEYNSDLCDINIEFIERLISKYIDNMQALGE